MCYSCVTKKYVQDLFDIDYVEELKGLYQNTPWSEVDEELIEMMAESLKKKLTGIAIQRINYPHG